MYDESKPEPIFESDTDNHTKFYGDDPKADYFGYTRLDGSRMFKNHYDRLSKQNRGLNGKWFSQGERRRQDNLMIFDAIANSLELPKYHHTGGRIEFEQMPIKKWSSPDGIDVFLVAIMVCAVVFLKDSRYERRYNPDRNDENNDKLFVQLIQDLSYRDSEIRSCYQKVLYRFNWRSFDWSEYAQN